MLSLGEATRALNQAGETMRKAEDYERLALLRITQVGLEASPDELQARYDVARDATAARVRAQISYANARTAVAMAWEQRGEVP